MSEHSEIPECPCHEESAASTSHALVDWRALNMAQATNPAAITHDEEGNPLPRCNKGLRREDAELLEAECEKYGLPVSLSLLLRHIYANRDFTYAAKDKTISILQERLDQIDD